MEEFQKKHVDEFSDKIKYLKDLQIKYKGIHTPLNNTAPIDLYSRSKLYFLQKITRILALVLFFLFLLTISRDMLERIIDRILVPELYVFISESGKYLFILSLLLFFVSSFLKKIRNTNTHLIKYLKLSEEVLSILDLSVQNETTRFNNYAESIGLNTEEFDKIKSEQEKTPSNTTKKELNKQDDDILVSPNSESKKVSNFIKNIKKKFSYDLTEPILFYYDSTVFGSGSEGIAVTDNYIISTDDDIGILPFDKIKIVKYKTGMLYNRIILILIDNKKKLTMIVDKTNSATLFESIKKIWEEKKF